MRTLTLKVKGDFEKDVTLLELDLMKLKKSRISTNNFLKGCLRLIIQRKISKEDLKYFNDEDNKPPKND